LLERSQSEFGSDVRAAATAVLAAPSLLVTTLAVGVVPAVLDAAGRHRSLAFLETIGTIIGLLTIGFYGTQRVWLLRLYRGQALAAPEVWALTRGYFRRFAALGIRVFWPVAILMIAVVLVTRNLAALLIAIAVMSYVLDTLLTFVVPELTFTTASSKQAWRSGRQTLKDTWPQSRWYVLAPGLAVLAVANVFGGRNRSVWEAAVVALVASAMSLVFRGAILNYYLRLRPDIPDYNEIRATPPVA
jgi:hypothetical protein